MAYRHSIIKSIQRGTVTLISQTTNTATISAVDVNNSVLRWLGSTFSSTTGDPSISTARITLTDSTHVTATQNTSNGNTTTVSFEVIEYYPRIVKSIQRGTASSSPVTITAVDITKSELTILGYSITATSYDSLQLTKLVLANSTTITVTGGATVNATASWQVVEYY